MTSVNNSATTIVSNFILIRSGSVEIRCKIFVGVFYRNTVRSPPSLIRDCSSYCSVVPLNHCHRSFVDSFIPFSVSPCPLLTLTRTVPVQINASFIRTAPGRMRRRSHRIEDKWQNAASSGSLTPI